MEDVGILVAKMVGMSNIDFSVREIDVMGYRIRKIIDFNCERWQAFDQIIGFVDRGITL